MFDIMAVDCDLLLNLAVLHEGVLEFRSTVSTGELTQLIDKLFTSFLQISNLILHGITSLFDLTENAVLHSFQPFTDNTLRVYDVRNSFHNGYKMIFGLIVLTFTVNFVSADLDSFGASLSLCASKYSNLSFWVFNSGYILSKILLIRRTAAS